MEAAPFDISYIITPDLEFALISNYSQAALFRQTEDCPSGRSDGQ